LKPLWQKTLESLSRSDLLAALKGIRRGIERESLRVMGDSRLASTAHPASLGSPLTHAWLTTDYAEAQMEFITPAGTKAEETLLFMADLHRYVYRHLGEELLWPVSMPCTIETEADIALADYGTSNVGKMKTIYRRGLKNRYGSMMQVISGVHYNFSMPDGFWPVWQQIKCDRQPLQDFISSSYFGLIRNFFRFGWLIPYLFGASPAVDSSFFKHTRNRLPLQTMGRASYYLPKATSLRMSKLGYNAEEQDSLDICYNSLPEFVSGLRQAASQSNPVYEKIGVKQHGEYLQLNANTLQEEGELYAPIRPKRTAQPGEKLSTALLARGVEYVEVRSLDVNPYAATGIDLEQMRFLDVFLTYCLVQDSPEISRQQLRVTKQNLQKVATCGRDLSLELLDGETPRPLAGWAKDIFSDLAEVASLLDRAGLGENYQAALNRQVEKLTDPALTPSAMMLQDMTEQKLEVNELALNLAKKHRRKLLETDFSQVQAGDLAREAAASRKKQRELEEEKTVRFDDYLRRTLDSSSPVPSPPKRAMGECCQWPALTAHLDAWCEVL
jgi:glutamate--cysteine ligase